MYKNKIMFSPLRSHVAMVWDKTSMLSDNLLLFSENYSENYIKNVRRINSLKLYSIGNSCF